MSVGAYITVAKDGVETRIVAGSIRHGEQLKADFEKVGLTVTSPTLIPAGFERSDEEFNRAMDLFDLIE